jgi:hypothetical protein
MKPDERPNPSGRSVGRIALCGGGLALAIAGAFSLWTGIRWPRGDVGAIVGAVCVLFGAGLLLVGLSLLTWGVALSVRSSRPE